MWKCPACSVEVEDSVKTCPKCGYAKPETPDDAPAAPPIDESPAPAASAPTASASAASPNEASASKDGPKVWKYSGKAFRFRWILCWILTIAFIALGVWLMLSGKMGERQTLYWGLLLGVPAICWLWFICDYFYRTMFIQYRLTESHLYFEQGFMHRTIDTMELIGVNDLKMKQSLFDRVVNGGVGTVLVYSVSDKTDECLPMKGLENPQEVLETIDNARRRLRGRGFVQM